MSNNEQQHKSFANLISKNVFWSLNEKEKQQFYIENEIYKDLSKILSFNVPEIVRNDEKQFYTYHRPNVFLTDEIIENCFVKNRYWNRSKDQIIIMIKVHLNNAFDINDKRKIISKEYKKYLKKFKKLEKYKLHYGLLDNEKYDHFNISLSMMSSIKLPTVTEYITTGEIEDVEKFKNWREWKEFYKYNRILSFLIEYKKKYLNVNSITTNNQSTTNKKTEEKYFSKVFKGIDEECFFDDFLIEINAIDNKYIPIKRQFTPCCAAIFYSDPELKKEIFKPNTKERDFLEYLVKKYPAGFNNLKKPRLSDHSAQLKTIKPLLKEHLILHNKRKLEKKTTSQQQTNNKVN